MSVSFLNRTTGPRLAYIKRNSVNKAKPVVLFLTGLASDMMGSKAQYLDGVCAENGIGYVRFDFRGHGLSGGKFEDGRIGLWLNDAIDIIHQVISDNPVILVGSSMGGWVALLLARQCPQMVKGIIGLAAAPDFTKDIELQMNEEQTAELKSTGSFPLPSEYGETPYRITEGLLQDGERYCILGEPLMIDCSVRLIQGKQDKDVRWATAQRIYNVLSTRDKKIIYRPDGNHRLSTPEDLEVLKNTLMTLAV
jgi:pimeloyl-ACP methyl ester carboxylesterase